MTHSGYVLCYATLSKKKKTVWLNFHKGMKILSIISIAFWKVISAKARAKLGVKSYIQIIAISIWADCLPCVSVIVPPSYTCLCFASSVSLTAITSGCIPNTTGRVGGCAAWDVMEKWLCRFRIQRYTSFSTLPFMYKENTSIMSVGVCRGFLCEFFLSLKSANAHSFFFLSLLCCCIVLFGSALQTSGFTSA